MHIHKNDRVKLLGGVDASKEPSRVVKINLSEGTAIVQGRNMAWKHLKRSQDYPHGARVQKEQPIPLAKLMVICPNCSKATRVKMTVQENAKMRICAKCKKPLGEDK
ncbi:MAG: 50S ribosomal protein L24 [Candidatus Brocadiae bacterium]|nr:50S ribosomal protein L24 [Candidatus Brocadiia bacterium]